MTCSKNFFFSLPYQAHKGQEASVDIQHRSGRLVRCTWIHDGDTAVMASKGQRIPAWGKGTTVNPTGRVVQEFTTDSVEREPFSPCARLWAGINTLDETREYSCMGVCRSSRKKHRVWMPSKRCNRASNRLLEMFRNPPIVLFFKVAHGNNSGARSNGELLFRGRPANEGRSSVDTEQHEGRFPSRGGLFPNVSVPIYSVLPLDGGVYTLSKRGWDFIP